MEAVDISRYRQLVSSQAWSSLESVRPEPDAVTLGAPAARLLLREQVATANRPGRAADFDWLAAGFETLSRLARADGPMLGDSYGHRRDVYQLFVLHLHLAAFLKQYESMPANVWSACEESINAAVEPARQIERYAESPPPADQVAPVLWKALCLFETSKLQSRDADIEWADGVVHQIVGHPGKEGSLHPLDEADESFDLWTYRELTGLHALANLALLRRDSAWAKRVQEIAQHHQANTQPDFTTSQPWGVFAFLWSAGTYLFAEQQIHDASVEGGGRLEPLAAMLLADCAASLLAFDQ